jgi:hypothetical protein
MRQSELCTGRARLPKPDRRDEWSARLGWFDETWRAVLTAELRPQLEQRMAADDPQIRFNAREILDRLG